MNGGQKDSGIVDFAAGAPVAQPPRSGELGLGSEDDGAARNPELGVPTEALGSSPMAVLIVTTPHRLGDS